ncbi:MAG: hypothetical protein OXJ52_01555 [Oligoflexia bacterium]|nr:hypothetical protein [Oligoflexia bacterium]
MNCPVCKRKIEFEIPKEDIYYDCSHCQSSLLFSKGQCLVINAEEIDSTDLEKETSEKSLINFETSQIDQKSEEDSEQNTATNLSKEDSKKSETKTLFAEEIESETPQEDFNPETPSKEIQENRAILEKQNKEVELEKENIETEENFYPKEKTEVPELKEKSEEEPEHQAQSNLDPKEEEPSYKFEENPNELASKDFQDESISPPAGQKEEEDFSDVAEFARSQEEDTKGIYLYDLTLSEINSQNLKEEVSAILEDSYLNLPIEEEESLNLKDIIDKGQIKIPRISPVQAYIIVSSLMGLPLNIHWEQHHIADE